MSLRLVHDSAVQHRLGDLLAKNMAAANLLGRVQIVEEAQRKAGKRVPLATSSRLHVRFDEAADALLSAGFSVHLPNDLASNYLRGLTPVTKDTFDGLSHQYQKDAFAVAGTTDVRLIARIRDELAKVLQDGGTEQDFERAVAQITSAEGVEAINAFALDTVFTTNLHKAYALGRYEQQMEPATMDVLPYGQYMTVGDDRVRPEHAILDGFTARMEDRVWRKIYPPNGFNCRCIRVALMPDEVENRDEADEDGMARLPALAMAKVPQPGFSKVF